MANTETYENSTGLGRGPATLGPTELDGRPAGREDRHSPLKLPALTEGYPAEHNRKPLSFV